MELADNFYSCEGATLPRRLLYELYMESCNPNPECQVNSSSFGKIIRLVFPGLGTRRLGTRGNTRYHYSGIAIKISSSFYARYCSLLSQEYCCRNPFPGEPSSSSACQPRTSVVTSGNACSSGGADGYKGISKKPKTNLHCSPSVIYLKTEQEQFQYPWPGFSRFYLWQEKVGKKYPYKMVVLLANEYYSHCQDILHLVRMKEFHKVGECILSFWRCLQTEKISVMASPDVCQLFIGYDRQLFKEMENILLYDFLEEVPEQDMESIRLFSKNVELWLLNALKGLPLLLQTSKSKEVAVFIKRIRRKGDLSNIAKTMRRVLNSNSRVTVLRSDLQTVIDEGFLDVPGNFFQKEFRNFKHLQNDLELKCLNDFLSLLASSTDIRVLLNGLSSNLQIFVIQPCQNKEDFRNLASDFQLRWNFLLSAISKAMTLSYAESFGSWYLFNLLLVDFVAHVFLSCMEEEGHESFWVAEQNESSVLSVYEPSHLWVYLTEEQPQASDPQAALITLMESQSNFGLDNSLHNSELFGGHIHRMQV
ncbi:LOW QUALITY PROTEIN: DNA-binding protein RFX8 [Calypte anna]|uniref:LOW QUALITY PROTEIN: DNA-binding protein RFX8 n=1 Tax=Calypte anna TaxID=9244 RepID=UPI0011C42301|nr:LOW QUALITY PROTEIN: DNA-binding protein RFX8 [Calypte anna]